MIKYLILIIILILNVSLVSSETLSVTHKTSHNYKIDSFILPEENKNESKLENITKNIFKDINKFQFVSKSFIVNIVPVFYDYTIPLIYINEINNFFNQFKQINFNNVSVFVNFKTKFINDELKLSVFKFYKKDFIRIFDSKINYFTDYPFDLSLDNGKYNIRIYDNDLLIAESEDFIIKEFDDYIVRLKLNPMNKFKIYLQPEFNNSLVQLKFYDDKLYKTGKINNEGLVLWDNNEFISIPNLKTEYVFIVKKDNTKIVEKKIIFNNYNTSVIQLKFK